MCLSTFNLFPLKKHFTSFPTLPHQKKKKNKKTKNKPWIEREANKKKTKNVIFT